MVILQKNNELESSQKSVVSSAALWGAVVGQLFFGFFADKLGRKKGFIVTLSLVIIGSIASSLAFKTSHTQIFVSLAIFRCLLGIGIGGEYPLSATITAESSTTSNRGRMSAAVFSMQGVGSLVAALVGFTLLETIGDESLELVWRLCLGIGAVPGLLSLYFRITMEETDRFQEKKKETKKKVEYLQIFRKYWKVLIGTAGSWFLLDIVFYANGLFSTTILQSFTGEDAAEGKSEILSGLIDTSRYNIYLTLMALPGYWVGIYLIELKYFGRRNTQMIGFVLLGITYLFMGIFQERIKNIPWLFVFIYGITFFFTNAGANTTTFVLPSESFPTEVRATCHGISAAAGKIGAVIGAAGMAPILDKYGLSTVFYICAVVAAVGSIVNFFFTRETRGLSLEEIAESMDEEHAAKMKQNLAPNC